MVNDEQQHHTPPPLPPTTVDSMGQVPLNYGHAKSHDSASSVIGRIVLGFIGYVVVCVAWIGLANRIDRNGGLALGGWFFITLALLGVALYVRVRYKRAGYGYGILTALGLGVIILIGVVLLIIGLCFHGK